MEYIRDDFIWPSSSKRKLKVIIVGAGIGGLTSAIGLQRAGHDVIVLERARQINNVGAGIQIAPNAARILYRLGVLDRVMKEATILERNSLRRYETDEELGTTPLMPEAGAKYGAPLVVIHRADLQAILVSAAKSAGVNIKTNARVIAVDSSFSARVRARCGTWIVGDVLIAADGIKSEIRSQMFSTRNMVDRTIPTGDAAYRIQIPRSALQHDPAALALIDTPVGVRWMGPGGHIMAYPLKNGKIYNMILLHPQKYNSTTDETWVSRGNKKEMLAFYAKWSPLVRRLLSYVPEGEVLEWTLNSHCPLSTWTLNKTALLGDACHPMLPYVAQGAANAIEDAGVLTVALTLTDDVEIALAVYELVRKNRAEKIQDSAAATREALHLPDGWEQEKRDNDIRRAANGGGHPDLWSDRKWQGFMWGVDVMKETVDGWDSLKKRVERNRGAMSI